jgi:hypothetical protein
VERLIAAGEGFKGARVEKPRWDGILTVRGVLQAKRSRSKPTKSARRWKRR